MTTSPVSGPIVLVEDDADDQDLILDVARACGIHNQFHVFDHGKQALKYLQTTADRPLIIFCDINMPVMDGLQLRKEIQSNDFLRKKSIPFVFLSTDASPHVVEEAYDLTVQGFFKKPNTFDEFQRVITIAVDYWEKCKHVNSVRD